MKNPLEIRFGDALEVLRTLPADSVQCCVTSPPYFGLRDYGCEGQIGLEASPVEFIEKLVGVFREVRRVLKPDGTLWMNLGDSYAVSGCGGNPEDSPHQKQTTNRGSEGLIRSKRVSRGSGAGRWGGGNTPAVGALKPKDLIGIPWRVAFALQADGWYLRQDIIWSKPNPMPESVTDRCTKAHEYVFLFSKSARYYFNQDAIKEKCSESTHARLSQNVMDQIGSHRANGGGKTNGPMKAVGNARLSERKLCEDGLVKANASFDAALAMPVTHRNKRSVWQVATQPFSGAHFAAYPPDLVKPCVLAGSRPGDLVMDPFGGSGTTAAVALELGRRALLIELNREYEPLIRRRCDITTGLLL